MDRVRAFAWGYFVLFIAVVAVDYVPAFHDADGNLFGLLKLDLYDETLHLASAGLAGIAATWSSEASRLYFRLLGPLYVVDGVLGLITGSGFLDGGIFLHGPVDLPLVTRIFANLPHLVIGGLAIWVGYWFAAPATPSLSRWWRRWGLPKGWWRRRKGPGGMRGRWRDIVMSLVALLLIAALVSVVYIEGGCRSPLPGYAPILYYRPIVAGAERRPEAQTWLAYPHWYIVHSADSLGRHLAKAPPSAYPYWRDVRGFWSSYCLVNRVTGDMGGAEASKMGVYASGLGFSAGMLAKGAYENSLGRIFEWIGGWKSQDDAYAARVQQRYAAFQHGAPWYGFSFGKAFRGLWGRDSSGGFIRHWERRLVLSFGYGAKAVATRLIRTIPAAGAARAPAQPTVVFVARAAPGRIAALDPRLDVLRGAKDGRVGVSAKIVTLNPLIRDAQAQCGTLEQLYAY